MTAVDGHFHTTHGLAGMLGVDALCCAAVGTLLLVIFHRTGLLGSKPEVALAAG
jgi:hypothetical protein